MPTTAYIGLGSNLDLPREQIRYAIERLAGLAETRVLRDAGYFVSRPMGPQDQPDFVNTVVEIETGLTPEQLLEGCQSIEIAQRRIRTRRWGERSIDLDILLYGSRQIETDRLLVPHPGILRRDFVYLPLLALDKNLSIPGRGRLEAIINQQRSGSILDGSDHDCRYAGPIE